MTTTTMTPTPSASSLSVISSAVGSSLTTGIMEQVSTWRTGADTDDDDEASLEIYSNPSMNRSSFPSQVSRGESQGSGGSLLNGMEIMPTLHQLQFPQHPLDQHNDGGLLSHNNSHSDIMPPPSSTTSGYRRHSMSSHRPVFNRMKRPSQDDNLGDQFVPSTTRSSYHAMTADILSRSVRQAESRFQGGIAAATDSQADRASSHTPVNKSGFPSPQSTAPSPRVASVQNFIQPSSSGSIRGDGDTQRRPSSQPAQFRLSPNQLENSRQRSQSRRSLDEVEDEDDPMHRDPSRQPIAPSPRFTKEDPRLRDLGATLQKSLSFNGDDEYQDLQKDDEPFSGNVRSHSGRHHPYMPRPRIDSASQRMQSERHGQRPQFENFFRDRKGKARAAEDDRETVGKTPVLLNAINTSQTNVLSELQTAQRVNQDELAHFREELYTSLQLAFTRLAEQVEGVGRAVVSVENAQRETAQQLGLSIGSAMGDGFTKMTDTIQQQIQHQIQQALQPYQISQSIRQGSPFSAGYSQSLVPPAVPGSNAFSPYGGFGSTASSRQNPGSIHGGRNAAWRRSEPDLLESRDDRDDEEDNGRGKRRAVERPRSTSGSRRTIDRPRSEFES
ncbi:hypothetical protein BGZ80_009131 [Entomortierella chlamydospora]|uniref:Uncharacterized protein n=1 Tax=Entomortierella chlamydospora TaxID=101097 RepID=A0A9P6MWW0_9FUNG|nr:hypothetical protein BGZ80_009131 [Entomortierella chlamydospora]